MSDKTPVSGVPDENQPTGAPTHTDQGAPTDEAHKDAGDGYSTGSVPAGLTADEMLKQAEGKNDGGVD